MACHQLLPMCASCILPLVLAGKGVGVKMKRQAGPCGRCCAAVYSRFCNSPSETQANPAKLIAVCGCVGGVLRGHLEEATSGLRAFLKAQAMRPLAPSLKL